eukprot:UN00769
MSKQNRESESSNRLVNCFYCDFECKFKDLQSHCNNHHVKFPARVKGVPSIGELFAIKAAKKSKTSKKPSSTAPKKAIESVPPEIAPEKELKPLKSLL